MNEPEHNERKPETSLFQISGLVLYALNFARRKTHNADSHHHLNIGLWPRGRVLRPYPLGSGRRGRHRAGDNIVGSPHRLHARLAPLIVDKGAESYSRLPPQNGSEVDRLSSAAGIHAVVPKSKAATHLVAQAEALIA
jgi:hypothetical protein